MPKHDRSSYGDLVLCRFEMCAFFTTLAVLSRRCTKNNPLTGPQSWLQINMNLSKQMFDTSILFRKKTLYHKIEKISNYSFFCTFLRKTQAKIKKLHVSCEISSCHLLGILTLSSRCVSLFTRTHNEILLAAFLIRSSPEQAKQGTVIVSKISGPSSITISSKPAGPW